ncbi:uncharacterized protein LOC134820099 [Bolinopsis microptera]|uniref:uncharacterized protein LOC134820099 n=1 Tax=Bolinopsis microptera TaxID=2820187 RepID=UPI003078B245
MNLFEAEGENMLTIVGAGIKIKNQHGLYPPSYLMDGNLNNFAHSLEANDGMWMRVNLETQSSVTKVIIYNRLSCCKDRIVGASVFIKTGDEYVKDCGKVSSAENSYTFNCEGDGNVIEISQEGTVGDWNIAEIKVYGTPAKIPSPGLDI